MPRTRVRIGFRVPKRSLWCALAGVMGGGLMMIGAILPWFSLFAGLHPYPGTTGSNGWILLGAGLLTATGGVALFTRAGTRISWTVGAIGSASLLFSVWLSVGLAQTYDDLLANPMMVPQLGPGLFVAALGALLAALTPWLHAGATPLSARK